MFESVIVIQVGLIILGIWSVRNPDFGNEISVF